MSMLRGVRVGVGGVGYSRLRQAVGVIGEVK